MRATFELVMFDLDGTLVDTAGEIAAAASGALAEAGLGAIDVAHARLWIGQGMHRFMLRAWAHVAGSSEAQAGSAPGFDAAMASFERHYAAVAGRLSSAYPDAVETLRTLREARIATAVLTNKPERFTRLLLEAHGLDALIDASVCGDTLPEKKPHPSTVASLLERFNVARERALLVGDSETDVATARNAGIAVWLVPYGYNEGRPVADARPDRVIPGLRAVALAAEGRIVASNQQQGRDG